MKLSKDTSSAASLLRLPLPAIAVAVCDPASSSVVDAAASLWTVVQRREFLARSGLVTPAYNRIFVMLLFRQKEVTVHICVAQKTRLFL